MGEMGDTLNVTGEADKVTGEADTVTGETLNVTGDAERVNEVPERVTGERRPALTVKTMARRTQRIDTAFIGRKREKAFGSRSSSSLFRSD